MCSHGSPTTTYLRQRLAQKNGAASSASAAAPAATPAGSTASRGQAAQGPSMADSEAAADPNRRRLLRPRAGQGSGNSLLGG